MGILTEFLEPGRLRDGDLKLTLVRTSQADPVRNYVPVYHFVLALDGVRENVGGMDLRLGDSEALNRFGGQIGYAVGPRYRGRQLAARGVKLLIPLARRHGFGSLWITCSPDNIASRRTCERAGFVLQEIVDLPPGHEMYLRGERAKCRYRLDLSGKDPTHGRA